MFSAFRTSETRDKLLAKLAQTFGCPGGSAIEALNRMAYALNDLPDVEGAAVVAFGRDGRRLAVGKSLLPVELDEEQLSGLASTLSVNKATCPVSFRSSGNEALKLQAIAANAGGSLVAAVLLAGKNERPPQAMTDLVVEVAPWIAAAITAAMHAEAAARTEKLHALACRELGADEPDLAAIARELGELFQAAACTILIEEQATQTLRLSASTDPSLGKDNRVVYAKGEGLTGWVFEQGEPLRLARADDRRAVRAATGLERERPKFPERDREGRTTTHFLGVPVRAAAKTLGVVRMSRAVDAPHFTTDDEDALQFFGDLLGIALKRTWELLIAHTIGEAASISIAITRREPQPDGLFVPRLIYVNPGATEILGYDADAVFGCDARKLYATGAYEALHNQLQAKLREVVKQGRSELGPVDSALLHHDGSPRSVKISYRLLADRRIRPPEIYTIGVFRERTVEARGQAQHRRLMELLHSMGIAYFRADLDGKVLETSKAEAAILGYSEAEILRLNRAVLFENRRARTKLIRRVRRTEAGKLLPVRQTLRRKDRKRVFTEGYIRTIRETLEQGRPTVEGLYRDVTRRLELQSFVDAPADEVVPDEVLSQKFREREQRQHDYLSSLGHQLITPLGSLVGNLDDLRSGLLSDKAEIDDSLRWVTGQAKQCMRMVRNLSYLDKILRREPFVKREVSLAKICVETKIDFLHLLDEKRMRLVVDDRSLDSHLPVRGHADLLRQVMVNLVDNAIKYSRTKSTIEIRGMTWRHGRILEISNEGLPIPPDVREKIFERDFRTNLARATVPHGTGLGLWLVRRILEAHDATIACDQVEEDGRKRTYFRLTFPHPVPPRGRRTR